MRKIIFFLFLLTIISICPVFSQTADSANDTTLIRLEEHEKKIDAIKTDLDYVWVIISAALVFFMQAGFMSLEAGMARSKNSINVAIKNLTDFVLGVIGFWIFGFGLMFGKSHGGLFGTTDFLINIQNPWTAAFFIFQAVFVGTAATIDSGAICERAKLKQYILLSFLLSIFIYPVFGHWAWGSFLHGADPAAGGAGWLEAMGFKDFAGSSVVHSVGGWMALAGIIIVGPRLGKFEIDPNTGKKGKARKFQPGDMRSVFLGTFILFFGWYGFNCGSTLSATADIAGIALNTTLAACFGCLVSSVLGWTFHPEKKIEGDMIANGVLGGLVGITAGCAYVSTVSASIIGAISGLVVFFGSMFIERVLKLDDVVGAVPVHALCGAWGTIAVGIFIRTDMLDGMTRMEQLGVQSLGVATCFVWAFGLGLLFYFLVDKLFKGVRVSKEDELIGLNVAEHGATSSLLELANTMDKLTQTGNFNNETKVTVEYGTEVGDLASIFNKLIDKIKEALTESKHQQQVSEELLQKSLFQQKKTQEAENQLRKNQEEAKIKRDKYIQNASSMVGSVVDKTEEIQENMENTSEITREMYESSHILTKKLGTMLTSMTSIFSKVSSVDTVTAAASQAAGKTRVTITELQTITREITEMINFINDISEKTHVLSINSAIEATRANENGKGFSVISKEVQHLSRQTSNTAQNINEKVSGINILVNNVIESMNQITGIVEQIDSLNNEIIKAIKDNENNAKELEAQSKETIVTVENVADNVSTVVSRIADVSRIGSDVQKGLLKLNEDEN